VAALSAQSPGLTQGCERHRRSRHPLSRQANGKTRTTRATHAYARTHAFCAHLQAPHGRYTGGGHHEPGVGARAKGRTTGCLTSRHCCCVTVSTARGSRAEFGPTTIRIRAGSGQAQGRTALPLTRAHTRITSLMNQSHLVPTRYTNIKKQHDRAATTPHQSPEWNPKASAAVCKVNRLSERCPDAMNSGSLN